MFFFATGPRKLVVAVVLLIGVGWIYASSQGWHLSCHVFDAKCVRILGINLGRSITANDLQQPVQSPAVTSAPISSTDNSGNSANTADSTTDAGTSTTSVPIATPSNPIRMDCADINGGDGSCYWVLGPGTGAEQNLPPHPTAGATYAVDVGDTCTWQDDGANAENTVETYTCR